MSGSFCFFVYVFTIEKVEGGYKDRVTEDIFKFEEDTLFSSDTSTVQSIVYLYISAVERKIMWVISTSSPPPISVR